MHLYGSKGIKPIPEGGQTIPEGRTNQFQEKDPIISEVGGQTTLTPEVGPEGEQVK